MVLLLLGVESGGEIGSGIRQDGICSRNSGEHLAGGEAERGVFQIGSKFGERNQDKTALRHRWMWNVHDRGMELEFVEQEDIEVDTARALGTGAFASHSTFDIEQESHEALGIETGFESGYRIEEPWLIFELDGRRLIERR